MRAIAELRLSDAVTSVADAEERFALMRTLFGEDSVQYKAALKDLEDAHKKLKEADDAHNMTNLTTGLAAFQTLGIATQTVLTVSSKISVAGGLSKLLGLTAAGGRQHN